MVEKNNDLELNRGGWMSKYTITNLDPAISKFGSKNIKGNASSFNDFKRLIP